MTMTVYDKLAVDAKGYWKPVLTQHYPELEQHAVRFAKIHLDHLHARKAGRVARTLLAHYAQDGFPDHVQTVRDVYKQVEYEILQQTKV